MHTYMQGKTILNRLKCEQSCESSDICGQCSTRLARTSAHSSLRTTLPTDKSRRTIPFYRIAGSVVLRSDCAEYIPILDFTALTCPKTKFLAPQNDLQRTSIFGDNTVRFTLAFTFFLDLSIYIWNKKALFFFQEPMFWPSRHCTYNSSENDAKGSDHKGTNWGTWILFCVEEFFSEIHYSWAS